mmetsp:Transcript_2766/g.8350  ORF Transcript_2766/g.8350 Transcript_2766/m.8350 type:complete len:655 (-) Transcript_2766:53-2017(-)
MQISSLRRGYLLWAAAGTSATLSVYDFGPIFSTFCGSVVAAIWIVSNVTTRMLIVSFLNACVDIFFRQVGIAGAHKLNISDGPLLLAIAPHANQFIDPMILLKTFERPVGFLCAAKSMRYKRGPSDIIAFFANGLDCVPVERPQDIAKVGPGAIAKVAPRGDGTFAVHGAGTAFTQTCKAGDQLLIAAGPCKGASAKLVEITSDGLAIAAKNAFSGSDADPESSPNDVAEAPYKMLPKVDQHDTYTAIYDRLDANGIVGIFPEGGSHDRASLLPLKAGIAVMALGACQRHGEALRSRLRVVAVGLNYFSGHRFRSRVFVDYGEPFEVSAELVQRYASGDKRGAGDALMAEILTAIKAVTVQAPSSDMAETFWMIRRLYVPDGTRLTLEEKVALTRGFAASIERDGPAHAEVRDVLERVRHYHGMLKHYALHDRQVGRAGADDDVLDRIDAMAMLSFRSFLLVIYAVVMIPGILLASPLLMLSDVFSRYKARVAVAGSRVKLAGRDVLATWKVVCGIVFIPSLHAAYTAAVWRMWSHREAVAYFFFMPFVSYTSIVASESFLSVFRSIGPLYVLITQRGTGRELRETRRALQTDVRALANKLGWAEIIRKSQSHNAFGDAGGLAGMAAGAPPARTRLADAAASTSDGFISPLPRA